MELTRTRALRGPNMWSRHTALELLVRCEGDELDVQRFKGFEQRLQGLCPGVALAGLKGQRRTLAHALEVTVLAVQVQAGCPVTFSRTIAATDDGLFFVVVEYSEEAVGRRALELAQGLVGRAWDGLARGGCAGEGPDVAAQIDELREFHEDERLGPSTGSIVHAGVARGIPYRRLTSGSLVQLGWGCRQRRIQAAELDATSVLAEEIAQDKDLTKHLLRAAGVPVPLGRPVGSADEAWQVALQVGLPVVVKPQFGNQGKGVTVDVNTREQTVAAYASAAAHGDVMVERYLKGSDHRLLVVGDRLIAAARRDPPFVVGDGRHTVQELVDIVNQDPRRGVGHSTSLTRIPLDAIALKRLSLDGLEPQSVPERGQRVVLRNNANLSTGGSATDVTDDVHPEVAAIAVDAARTVGLHVCGVDVICETVHRPLHETGGGVVEVNAAPGLRMHLSPSYGKGRDVGSAIIGELFEPGNNGRIPVIAITGVNGKTTTTRLIAHTLAHSGLCVGMTNTDGVFVDGRQTESGDCSGPLSAQHVLAHPEVQAAVLETARGGILRAGLGFDQCDVAVVTNVGAGDHLGLNHLHTPQDIARCKKVIVQNVAKTGHAVLNATDPLVVAMAAECPGKVIFFAIDGELPLLAAHRGAGGRVVCVEDGQVVAIEGRTRMRLPLSQVPLTLNGAIGFQVENVLAAVGACWSAGMAWDAICAGMRSFSNSTGRLPGRFNLMQHNGATIVADYGHNPDAMRALLPALRNLPRGQGGQRLAVVFGVGDRRDQDIREITEILGHEFDSFVLFENGCQRGRPTGSVIQLLKDGLDRVGAKPRRIVEVQGEQAALEAGLALLGPGDQCLMLIDEVQDSLAFLADKVKAA